MNTEHNAQLSLATHLIIRAQSRESRADVDLTEAERIIHQVLKERWGS